ncbi:MAG: C10 family peptidase [Prevotella sp.]|nr:C10 family peptidase [Prevotella sp.]
MMRRYLAVIVMAVVSCVVMANPVTKAVALQKAKLFAKEQFGNRNENVVITYQSDLKGKPGHPALYVCNYGNDKGYVILSGDDRTVPVLAYSDHGSLDVEHMPENMKWWLQYYEEAIEQVVDYQLTNKMPVGRPTDVIKPLIKTKWDQTWPFNEMCPSVNAVRCPTGCVATAMAQVLNYHRCPADSTNAIDAYTTYTHKVNMPKLAPTTFDWDNMLDVYGRNATQEQRDAVAKLMLYCGQAVQMDYTPNSSGANTDYLGYLLPRYFNLPNTIHNVTRYGYTIEQWDSILINELKHNRPVLYTGYTMAMEGHAFVCDGYDGNGYYHINWGWGGDGDDYFRISVLDASANGTGGSSTSLRFSVLQSAIIGITREGEDEFVAPDVPIVAFSRSSLKYGREYVRDSVGVDFTNIVVDIPVFYDGNNWYNKYKVGLALFDDEGNIVKTVGSTNVELWPGYPDDTELTIKLGKGIENGHYKLKTMFWENGGGVPKMARNADVNYIDAQIQGDTLTLQPVPKGDFKVTRVRRSGSNVVVRLTNGDEWFDGFFYLRKYNSKGAIEEVAMEPAAIEPNSTRDIAIYVDNDHSIDLDNEVYFLSVDSYEDQFFYTNAYNEGAQLQCRVDFLNLDDEGTAIVGDKVICNVTVANNGVGEYRHFVGVNLVNEQGEEMSENKIVSIPSGDYVTLGMQFKPSAFDKSYKVVVKGFEGNVLKTIEETPALMLLKGAIYWVADGSMKTKKAESNFVVPDDALAINLKVAYTSNAQPNENPNTVYLLDKSVPKGLMGKNVVNYENKGGTITMDDRYDFYVPEDVTATVVPKYIRAFNAEDVGKWSTLTLPFAPIAISVDGASATWHQQGEDGEATGNAKFWLMEIVAVEGDQMTLDYASEIKANTTYIIAPDAQLSGKELLFEGKKNTTLKAGFAKDMVSKVDGFDITTNSVKTIVKDVYVLEGDRFVYVDEDTTLPAFRACLAGVRVEGSAIRIIAPALPDGIENLRATTTPSNGEIYNVMGVCVGGLTDLKNLPKGIYIIGGRKVMR